MIVVKIENGLGNQLYNYACGYAVACKTNQELKLDTSGCDNSMKRPYMLSYFKLDQHERESFPNKTIAQKVYKRFRKNIRYHVIKEDLDRLDDIWNKMLSQGYLRNIYLDGYWEDIRFFNMYKNDIVRQFRPAYAMPNHVESLLMKLSIDPYVCAVHMRGTDRPMLSSDFFSSAMEKMRNICPEVSFLIFTDDKAQAKKNMQDIGSREKFSYQFIDEYGEFRDIDEFFLMNACRHQIVPDSTFSRWAALLNTKPGRMVIALDYQDEKKNKRYYPEDWILIARSGKAGK